MQPLSDVQLSQIVNHLKTTASDSKEYPKIVVGKESPVVYTVVYPDNDEDEDLEDEFQETQPDPYGLKDELN